MYDEINSDLKILEQAAKITKNSSFSLSRKYMVVKAEKEILDYWNGPADSNGYIHIGKYLGYDLRYGSGILFCSLWLTDDAMESRLHDLSFGSHSGIGEFTHDVIFQVLSAIIGNTDYSHAFATFNLNDATRTLNSFAEKYEKAYGDEEHGKLVRNAKQCVEYLHQVSEDKNVSDPADALMECILEQTRKNCSEEG